LPFLKLWYNVDEDLSIFKTSLPFVSNLFLCMTKVYDLFSF
jgi:hypothetical protein